MAGMINSKIKDIKRTNIAEPDKVFEMDSLNEVNENPISKPRPPKKKVVTTSIRVDKLTQIRLSTLVSLDKADTVNSLIDILLDDYVFTRLSKQDRENYEMLLAVFKSKAGMK